MRVYQQTGGSLYKRLPLCYSQISSLTSTVLIFLAAIYEKTKKQRQISAAGMMNVINVMLLPIRVSPTILSSISRSGLVKNSEQTPPIAEPIAETIINLNANCVRSSFAVKPSDFRMPMSPRSLINAFEQIIFITTIENRIDTLNTAATSIKHIVVISAIVRSAAFARCLATFFASIILPGFSSSG